MHAVISTAHSPPHAPVKREEKKEADRVTHIANPDSPPCADHTATITCELRALFYDIFPPTTAITDYTTGLAVYAGAETAVSFQQTVQIISAFSFITAHVAYASTNKTKIV